MQLVDTRTPEVKALATKIKSAMSSLVVAHSSVQQARNTLHSLLQNDANDARGMLFSAPSGMGKTNFSLAIVRNMNQGVTHDLEADNRPVLLIESPNSSVRGGMAHLLLKALGDLSPNKGNLEEKLDRIDNYIKRQKVQLIIIDEIHNYLPTRATSTPTQAVSFLKDLMNRTKVPVLFMGTHEAEKLISFYDEMASRIRPRVVRFDNFSISTPERLYEFAQVIEEYAKLLNQAGTSLSFFKLVDGVKVIAQENLVKRIYAATNGNLRDIRNLFYAMVNAVLDGEKPTLEGFANIWLPAMNEQLGFNPFIQANDVKVAKHILNISKVKGH